VGFSGQATRSGDLLVGVGMARTDAGERVEKKWESELLPRSMTNDGRNAASRVSDERCIHGCMMYVQIIGGLEDVFIYIFFYPGVL